MPQETILLDATAIVERQNKIVHILKHLVNREVSAPGAEKLPGFPELRDGLHWLDGQTSRKFRFEAAEKTTID
jgi:hypothetical protein